MKGQITSSPDNHELRYHPYHNATVPTSISEAIECANTHNKTVRFRLKKEMDCEIHPGDEKLAELVVYRQVLEDKGYKGEFPFDKARLYQLDNLESDLINNAEHFAHLLIQFNSSVPDRLQYNLNEATQNVIKDNYDHYAYDLAKLMRFPYGAATHYKSTDFLSPVEKCRQDKIGPDNDYFYVAPNTAGGVTLHFIDASPSNGMDRQQIWDKLFDGHPVKIHLDEQKSTIALEFPNGLTMEDHVRNMSILKEVATKIELVARQSEFHDEAREHGSKNVPRDGAARIREELRRQMQKDGIVKTRS